jgi:hypothetical protein
LRGWWLPLLCRLELASSTFGFLDLFRRHSLPELLDVLPSRRRGIEVLYLVTSSRRQMKPLVEAGREFAASVVYYESREPGLGLRFRAEVEAVVDWMRRFPEVPGCERRLSAHKLAHIRSLRSLYHTREHDLDSGNSSRASAARVLDTQDMTAHHSMQRTGASSPVRCLFIAHWWLAAAADADCCSPNMRAKRAKLKSRRDVMKIAQGKRGTSAALGKSERNEDLPCFLVWRSRRRAKPGNTGGGIVRRFTQDGCRCAPLPRATIFLPLRGACS